MYVVYGMYIQYICASFRYKLLQFFANNDELSVDYVGGWGRGWNVS